MTFIIVHAVFALCVSLALLNLNTRYLNKTIERINDDLNHRIAVVAVFKYK